MSTIEVHAGPLNPASPARPRQVAVAQPVRARSPSGSSRPNGLDRPSRFAAFVLAALLAIGAAPPRLAEAHGVHASEASALSVALPVAVSMAAPAMVLSGAALLTVAAVEASAAGTVWVLERASDGARASVHFAGHASAAVGAAVLVTAVSTGWVISAAGHAIAFVPNEIGRALLHNERITR